MLNVTKELLQRPVQRFVAFVDTHVTDHVPGAKALKGPQRVTVNYALAALAVLSAMCTLGWSNVSTLFGFVYPTLQSARLLREPSALSEKESRRWLTYWVVFGFLCTAEGVCALLLLVIPLYTVAKVTLLAWLMHPQLQGAEVLYTKLVNPTLLRVDTLVQVQANRKS